MGESGVDLLPEDIVDLILSKAIPTSKDAIRLSRVSKQFFSLLRNRSALTLETHVSCDWYEELFWDDYETYQKEVRELRHMFTTLKRYHEENIHLDSLKFHFSGKLSDPDARDFDESIKLAAKQRLTRLDLSLDYGHEFPEPFFQVESLVELRLNCFSLQPADSLTVRLPSLRKLQLDNVSMRNEGELESFIKSCPSIETLSIGSCYLDNQGSSFKVSNLPNLKALDIGWLGDKKDELIIEVHASAGARVEHLKCRRHPVNLGEHEYPNLKILELHKDKIGNAGNFFINFASKFPRLEYLALWPGRLVFGKHKPLDESYFDC